LKTKRSETLIIRRDEFIDWDVLEISFKETREALLGRTTIWTDQGPTWHAVEFRHHDGHMLRRTGSGGIAEAAIMAENLPRIVDGEIRCVLASRFLRLLSPFPRLSSAGADMLRGVGGYHDTNTKRWIDKEILECGRDRMKALTETMLSRLVLIDGEVWKKVIDPRIVLHGYKCSALASSFDFNERDERWEAPADPRHMKRVSLPLCEAHRIGEIAEKLGHPLGAVQVAVDSIAIDAPICRDGPLWTAWHAAECLVGEAESEIGVQSSAAVASWLELRDAVSVKAPGATAEDVIAMVVVLTSSLGPDCEEIVARVDEMIDFIDHPRPIPANVAPKF
jgi:hypothetical protein